MKHLQKSASLWSLRHDFDVACHLLMSGTSACSFEEELDPDAPEDVSARHGDYMCAICDATPT